MLAAAPAYALVVLLILLPVRFIGSDGLSEIAAGRLMIALSAPLLVLPLMAGFATLLLMLCAVTVVTANVVFVFLGRGAEASSDLAGEVEKPLCRRRSAIATPLRGTARGVCPPKRHLGEEQTKAAILGAVCS